MEGKYQLGALPHKISNDATVINELTLDSYHIQKYILAMKQNEASAYYDRILKLWEMTVSFIILLYDIFIITNIVICNILH